MPKPIAYKTGSIQPPNTAKQSNILVGVGPSNWGAGAANTTFYNSVDSSYQYVIIRNSNPPAMWATGDFTDASLLTIINGLPDRVGSTPFTAVTTATSWLFSTGTYSMLKNEQPYGGPVVSGLAAGFNSVQKNLFVNGDFNNIESGNPFYFGSYGGSSTVIDITNDKPYVGSKTTKALQITNGGNYMSTTNLMEVGKTYTFSFWARKTDGTSGNIGYDKGPYWNNQNGQGELNNFSYPWNGTVLPSTTIDATWRRYAYTFYYNAARTTFFFYGVVGVTIFTEFQIEEGSVATNFSSFPTFTPQNTGLINTGNWSLVNGAYFGGKYGGSYNFDGVDDRITYPMGYSTWNDKTFTIESWFEWGTGASNANNGWFELAGAGGSNWGLSHVPRTGVFYFYWISSGNNEGCTVSNSAIQDNVPLHMAITFNGVGGNNATTLYNNTKIYINGVLQTNNFGGSAGVSSNSVISVGGQQYPFKGNIYTFNYYNRVLSNTEIQNIYSAGVPIYLPSQSIVNSGLSVYYDFSNPNCYGGEGTTIYDLSGYNNNGTLINGTSYSTTNGGALVFDGVDDYVQFTSTYAGTICFWGIMDNNIPGLAALVGIDATGDGALRTYGINFNSFRGAVPPPYIAGAADANDYQTGYLNQFMINGVSNLPIDYQGFYIIPNNRTLNQNFYVGAIGNRNVSTLSHLFQGRVFKGKMFKVMIYNRQLTNAELLQNYNATKAQYGL
jgi:hypothetical protein